MRAFTNILGGIAFAAFATPAAAHGNADFLGPVYGAFLHTILVPAEALALIATGLALGISGRRTAQLGVAAFAAALAIGLLVGVRAYSGSSLQLQLVVVALVGAALVAAELKMGTFGAFAFAVFSGLTVGLDAFPDATSARTALVAGGATLIGGSLAMALVAGLVVDRIEFWQRISVRVAGSWIVAISILYLAWSITTLS